MLLSSRSQDYKPDLFAWRLVLITRKLCLVCITLLTGKNAMFQASLSLAVLAVSYGLHAKYHPFVTSVAQATARAEHTGSVEKSAQAERLARRLGRRTSQVLLDLVVSGASKTAASVEVLQRARDDAAVYKHRGAAGWHDVRELVAAP